MVFLLSNLKDYSYRKIVFLPNHDSNIDTVANFCSPPAFHKTSQAAAEVARATGLDRKMLYARAMELK